MEKKKKIPLIILAVVAILALLVFLLGLYAENKIKAELDKVMGPESSYGNLDVNLLQRKISLTKLDYDKEGKSLAAEKISASGISFYQFLANDKVVIGELKIQSPNLVVRPSDSTSKQQSGKQKEILIKEVTASNGVFRYVKDSVSNEIFLSFPEVSVDRVKIDSSTTRQKIPFNYESYKAEFDSLRVNMNPEHFVAASAMSIENGQTEIKDFRIIPYYEKEEFDRQIEMEKDRISLRVNSIQLDSLQFYFRNDSLHLENNLMQVTGGNLQIYRNKLLPDDPSTRSLYSEMLRKAPVKLNFKKLKVDSTQIEYEEKAIRQRPAAKVGFYDVSLTANNIVNMRLDREDFPRTEINANASFMHAAPVEIDWSFNVTNMNDQFVISGEFGSITGQQLNSFLRPAMGAEAEGTIKDVYFTFTGNEEVATGDVRLDYDNFKIILLEEGSRDEKGFFTAIANLFIDNDGTTGVAAEKDVRVTRDKNRSFWSFVWSGLRKGIRESFTQL